MSISEYIKAHRSGLIILSITTAISMFLGGLGVRLMKLAEPKNNEIVHDTVYVKPSKADSLLLDISEQVTLINSKIPEKRPVGKKRIIRNDTIRVDATIHVDKNGEMRNQ